MKQLLHFQCMECGYRWSVWSDSMVETLDRTAKDGCPQRCSSFGRIRLVGRDTRDTVAMMHMFAEGLGACCPM